MKHILCIILVAAAAFGQLTAQDLIVPKSGAPITAYNVDASGTFVYYNASSDANGQLLRIAKDSVLMVRMADGTVLELGATAPAQTVPAAPAKPTTNYPEIAEEDIHGSLIAKGNKVFIPTDSQLEAERAGQEQLKKRVEEWGYWTVVDKLEQSHFVLQFYLKNTGKDMSYLVIRPRKYYVANPILIYGLDPVIQGKTKGKDAGICFWGHKSDDSDPQLNTVIANILFESLKGILTDPDYRKNACSANTSAYELFYEKKVQKCLDADSKSNEFSVPYNIE